MSFLLPFQFAIADKDKTSYESMNANFVQSNPGLYRLKIKIRRQKIGKIRKHFNKRNYY